MGNRINDVSRPAGRRELVELISRDLDTTKVDANIIVDSVTRGIAQLLANSPGVRVPNLGDFRVRETAERTGRNPRTGKAIAVAPGRRIFFRAAKNLKLALNGRGGSR